MDVVNISIPFRALKPSSGPAPLAWEPGSATISSISASLLNGSRTKPQSIVGNFRISKVNSFSTNSDQDIQRVLDNAIADAKLRRKEDGLLITFELTPASLHMPTFSEDPPIEDAPAPRKDMTSSIMDCLVNVAGGRCVILMLETIATEVVVQKAVTPTAKARAMQANTLMNNAVEAVQSIARSNPLKSQRQPQTEIIDFGLSSRFRVSDMQFTDALRVALTEGRWLMIIRANACLRLLRLLSDLLAEIRAQELHSVDPGARIIVFTEPHPHFPGSIVEKAQMISLQAGMNNNPELSTRPAEELLLDSFAQSTTKLLALQGDPTLDDDVEEVVAFDEQDVKDIHNLRKTGSAMGPTALDHSSSTASASSSRPSSAASSGSGSAPLPRGKKRVKVNTRLDVVDIAPRDTLSSLLQMSNLNLSNNPLKLKHQCSTGKAEAFYCVSSFASAPISPHQTTKACYVIGSSSGSAYFVDGTGASLLSTKIHGAGIWDLCFCLPHDRYEGSRVSKTNPWLVTACEDASVTSCGVTSGPKQATVTKHATKTIAGGAVYCAKMNNAGSHLGFGGSFRSLMVQSWRADAPLKGQSDKTALQPGATTTVVPLPDTSTTIQSLAAFDNSGFVVGTGNGCIALINDLNRPEFSTVIRGAHSKKIPAMHCPYKPVHCDCLLDRCFLTGSFDGTLSFWDPRTLADANDAISRIKLDVVVSGIAADGPYVTACAGENLLLWDSRKLSTLLGHESKVWKGLSRGIAINADEQTIVTASPDGLIRLWSF